MDPLSALNTWQTNRSKIPRIYFERLLPITALFSKVTAEDEAAISISFWETACR
jgi:hypothetical protein